MFLRMAELPGERVTLGKEELRERGKVRLALVVLYEN